MPHDAGHCYTNVIRDHWCSLGHSCTNVIRGLIGAPRPWVVLALLRFEVILAPLVILEQILSEVIVARDLRKCRLPTAVGKMRQTWTGPGCSSLTLEYEEHLKMQIPIGPEKSLF
jgi:hypothetical protein